MTLIKSVLLGSAATLVVVAGAQAADLPTKKGAPAAEYVKVCKIGDIAGFIIPGSDTCLKIGGLVSAQTTFASTATQYAIVAPTFSTAVPPKASGVSQLSSGTATNPYAYTANKYNQIGMYTRGRVTFDAVSNTAYGPLLSHIAIEENQGGGYDSSGAGFTIDGAYLQWAGITAGFHTSFFDFIGGGYAWDDMFSAKFDPTDQLAYTATFGGGFSATLSLELPEARAAGTYAPIAGGAASNALYGPMYAGTALGDQVPDIVAALDVTQGWGSAHIAGLLHQVRQYRINHSSAEENTNSYGYGILGGVSFNIPGLGAGADIKLQGQYTDGAIGYTHLFGIGDFNFSGIAYNGADGDAYYDNLSGSWKKPTAWGVATQIDLPLGPTFKIVPEASYGQIHLSTPNSPGYGGVYSSLSPNVDIFVGGATLEWTPVKNLVFDLDLLYGDGHQDTPHGWNTVSGASAWKSDFSGFNGKLRIERDF